VSWFSTSRLVIVILIFSRFCGLQVVQKRMTYYCKLAVESGFKNIISDETLAVVTAVIESTSVRVSIAL